MTLLSDIIQQRCCLTCNRNLHGRSDKKFCNDQCRNIFNNRQNSTINNYMRSIDNHLRRNRRILQHVLGEKRFVVTQLHKLNTGGFAFSFCTHTHTSRNGNTYRFCYDYGYLVLPGGHIRIVCKPSFRCRFLTNEIEGVST